MTGTQKFRWGMILNITGVLINLLETWLTSGRISVKQGLPMTVIALVLTLWGVVWLIEGQSQRTQGNAADR